MPFTHPDNITVPPGRYRKDFASVAARAEDIKKVGQLLPILVREEDDRLILIDGECRLRACKLLDRDIWYTTNQDGKLLLDNEFQHRIAEYMCNIARQDMSPVEKSKAITDLDRLMKETYGRKGFPQSADNLEDQEGHSSTDTAKMLGYKDRRTVSYASLITKAAETMPELSEAKSMSEAMKMVRTKVHLEAQEELARRRAAEPQQGVIADPLKYFSERMVQGDCLACMKELPSGIATIFLTDIPYGIDYKTEELRDGKSAKKNLAKKVAGLYHDLPEDILPLVEGIIKQMARVGRPNCFAYMFCAYRYWTHLSIIFENNGFEVYNKPVTWVRGSLPGGSLEPGGCNCPSKWPASNTDCILFARRGDVDLAKQGQSDVIICPSYSSSKKIHSLQRPIPLLTELISRVFHPNTKGLLIDPFAGSGSSLAAAMRFEGLEFLGYELDSENRKRAVAYLVNEYTEMTSPKEEKDFDLDV